MIDLLPDRQQFTPGNLRVDYVLPRKNMRITDAGVFWPLASDPTFALVGTFPFPSSDAGEGRDAGPRGSAPGPLHRAHKRRCGNGNGDGDGNGDE